MLILLPPSETKTVPAAGSPVRLDDLSLPELAPDRERVLAALEETSGRHDALEALGVGPSLGREVARNLRLRTEPTAPALEVYTGVLYDALDHGSMTAWERAVAAEAVVVISALWGAVRPGDRIPAYRLSMGTTLPGVSGAAATRLSSYWKPRLLEHLGPETEGRLIIDCRSAAYAAAFAVAPETTVTVRAVRETGIKRTVVSHFAKRTRGELAGHAIRAVAAGQWIETPEQLAEVAARHWRVELVEPTARRAGVLTVVLDGD